MSPTTLVVTALAVLIGAGRPTVAAGRPTGRLRGRAGRRSGRTPRRRLTRSAVVRIAAGGLGAAVALVVGGPVGMVIGVLSGVAADRVLRNLEPAEVRRRRGSRAGELPLTLDLLAVCLRAGMPLVAAMETVAVALPGPFSDDLRMVAGLQRLGATPAVAWAELAMDDDLATVARAVARSAESGSRLAASFEQLAADRRSALAAAGMTRAKTAGVLAMVPLGLCFLPAFICLGVVPIVLSMVAQVLPWT